MARSGSASGERLIAGRYRIEALLGKGGMGAVYAAVDTSVDKRLAIKITSHDASAKVLELFKREFQTLHGLRHPSIVEVYDFGSDPEGLFYTMELLEGGDLGRAAPVPWRLVCSYLRQTATLLGLLHARRLLHRDVTARNLWVLPDGRLKMIDFGALCPFGVPNEIVGTPPFLAPEWLQDRAAAVRVDQRADLYALGALAYWLLTSVHAFPARTLNELPSVWARKPATPSSLASLVETRVLEPIPSELDELVLALLRRDPEARPETIEVVIDRIDAIAGPPEEAVDHAVRGYVRSKAFVGRAFERRLIDERLRRAQGGAVMVEAEAGLGRSRLLEELTLIGRLAGATPVLVRAGQQEQAYGVASRIAVGLLKALPQESSAAAQTHAQLLAQLSPELQRLLGVTGTLVRSETPSGRSQLQTALTEWLFALATKKRLLLAVDDVDLSDEESASWLAALAPYCADNGLLIVVARVDKPGLAPALPLQMFRNAAVACRLAPLTRAEVHELLHSVFGPATYLERVVDVLSRVSHGSPAHCLELVEHLVETGSARYSEGSWALPGHLADEGLPRNRSQMHLARLEQLGANARSLAELMSIHDGPLTQRACLALSESGVEDTTAALVELVLLGVLQESEQGYGFVHASVRDHLLQSLAPERRTQAHARLGASLLAAGKDPIERMRAGLHLFRAGEVRRCEELVRAATMYLTEGHRAREHGAVPLFEQAVSLYRGAALGPERLAAPLAALASAGFFVDRRLADRYGMEAIEALERTLRFDLARKWRRPLGAGLAFFVALFSAGASRRRRGGLKIGDALKLMAATAVGLNGVAASSMNLAMTERCKLALEPLAALGQRNVVGLVRACAEAVSGLLSEDYVAALTRLQALRSLVESDRPIRGLNSALRREFIGGVLFASGIHESWRQSMVVLEIADRLQTLGPLFALNADQLRSMHYGCRGDSTRALYYRRRVETQALQVGAAWQIVAIEPIGLSLNALWVHDALAAKRAAAELERLTHEVPSFRLEAVRARAVYLVLTGRYREAVDLMRESDAPRGMAGWSRGQGILARAHNRLGEHARAREVCLDALAGRTERDLSFVLMNLHVQIEWVLAEAALGNFELARAESDRLLVRHAAIGPVALGALHETRARVALLERDLVTCRTQCDAMQRQFAQTDVASLRELTERLVHHIAVAESRGDTALASPATLLGDDEHLMTRVRLILTRTDQTLERRAQLGLQIALELTGAERGFLLSPAADGGVIGTAGEPPDAELVAWASAQLSSTGDEQTLALTQTLGETAPLSHGHLRYCVIPLGPTADAAAPFALVLGFDALAPRLPSAEVLAVLARHLAEPSLQATP